MRFSMRPGPDMLAEKHTADNQGQRVPLLVLRPKQQQSKAPGVLWIHGGGYILGMKEMAYFSRAADLVNRFGAVVVSPGYRLAFQKPYPAAVEDCYAALLWLKEHVEELGINPSQIMVGGESAGGGLTAALCMLARDRGKVAIAFQMPLYPMIDNLDTESSRENHGRVWNTRRNHFGWRMYLRKQAKSDKVSPYAAAARQTDYSNLPPCYTFVCTGEPFYAETLAFVEKLKSAGVQTEVDIYSGNTHAFDMMKPDEEPGKSAIAGFLERFAWAKEHCFREQP